jgi:hypothetical protein
VAGWSSGWLAQLSFTRDSWTAPLDVLHRVAPADDAHAAAAARIRELLGRLPAAGPPPARPRWACSTPATTRSSWPGGWAIRMATASRCGGGGGAGGASTPGPTGSR